MTKIFYLIGFLFVFTSCSKKPVVVVEEKIERKTINQTAKDYRDVTEKKAIELVTSEDLNSDDVYNKIKNDKSPLFSWEVFWSKVREGNIYYNIDINQAITLNRLSILDCEVSNSSSYLSTASQVLNSGSGKQSLIGLQVVMLKGINNNIERCNSKASNFELKSMISSYKDLIRNKNSRRAINDFLRFIKLIKRNNEHRQFVSALEGVLVTDWHILSQEVLNSNDSRLLLQFLDAYKVVNPYARNFSIKVIESFLGNGVTLIELRDKLEIYEIAEILTRYYGNNSDLGANTNRRSYKKDLSELIDVFKRDFSKIALGDDVPVLVEKAFVSYTNIKRLAEVSYKESFSNKLTLFDGLTRELEVVFYQVQKESLNFLDYQAENNLSALWLKIRMNLKLHGEIPYIASDILRMVPLSEIDRVLQSRSLLYLEKGELKLKERIESHCALLKAVGVKNILKKVSLSKNAEKEITTFLKSRKPGCLKISSFGKQIEVSINDKNLKMKTSLDSIVIAEDINLNINVDTIDGPIFDLSAKLEHPPISYTRKTKEKWKKEADAIVIPVVLGFDTKNSRKVRSPFKKNRRHYFLYYYSARSAMDSCIYGENTLCRGPAPRRGYDGGNLNIATVNKRDSHPVKYLSLGGRGQEAPIPLPPGGGVEFEVEIADFKDLLPKKGHRKNLFPEIKSNSILKEVLFDDKKPDLVIAEKLFSDINNGDFDSGFIEQFRSQLELFSEYKGVCQKHNYDCIYKKASEMAYEKLFYRHLPESSDHRLIQPLVTDDSYEEFRGLQNPKTANGPQGNSGKCNSLKSGSICLLSR